MGPDAIILGFSMLSFSKPWGEDKKKKKKEKEKVKYNIIFLEV